MKKTISILKSVILFVRENRFVVLTIVLILIVAACLVPSLPGWSQPANRVAPVTDSGKTIESANDDVAVARGKVDIDGGIIQLAASRDGVIRKVLVDEGSHVQRNQILATLDFRRDALNLQLAQKDLDQLNNRLITQQLRVNAAQREEARLTRLVREKAASEEEFEQAKDQTLLLQKGFTEIHATLEAQKVRVKLAQLDIDQMSIRAPANGFIIRRQAKPGEGVSTLNITPLFWFVPDAPHIIRAELEERFVHAVSPGMRGEVFFEGNSTSIKAKVIRVGKLFGPKRNPAEDPGERNDVRVLEFFLEPIDPTTKLVLGQRALIRIRKQ